MPESKDNEKSNLPTKLAPVWFGLILFTSSFIMFLIEPYIAKKLLPYLGGSANVWNTCVVFFQSSLILGYLYSHYVTSRLKVKEQVFIHIAVLILPLVLTNLNYNILASSDEHPYIWLLSMLCAMVGALFLSLSTVAPLMQKWYTYTDAVSAKDPYFLFSASNLGSILGLVCYPFVIEPNMSLKEQGNFVFIGYIVLASMICLASVFVAISSKNDQKKDETEKEEVLDVSVKDSVTWLFLAAVPSSLVLGVTTFVTNELSSLPLFWIVPLVIYLLSFVIAFARPPEMFIKITTRLTPPAVLVVLALIATQFAETNLDGYGFAITTGISIHLLTLFLIACAFHGKLAQSRPPESKLTIYYLLISIGGIAGSCINTFLAPMLLTSWLEYPIVLLIAALYIVSYPKRLNFNYKDKLTNNSWLVTIASIASASACWKVLLITPKSAVSESMNYLLVSLPFLIPVMVTIFIAKNSKHLRLGLGLTTIILLIVVCDFQSDVVLKSRNFFGCLRVSVDRVKNTCTFWHGMTVHGVESLDPDLRGKPLSYFHPNGPVGRLLKVINSENLKEEEFGFKKLDPIAVVGLGCGSLAAYAHSNQKLVFYELSPDVIDIASNPFYFTYLFKARKKGVRMEIVAGDGRLSLTRAPYDHYKAIFLDAFNSDSIPTHLMTREALQLFMSKTKKNGLLAFQVTNNYYDLKPEIYQLARNAGLKAVYRNDYGDLREEKRFPTEWVVLTGNDKLIERLRKDKWKDLKPKKDVELWTDDYSNPLPLLITPVS